MYTESALPDQERMAKYRILAAAYIYPGEEFKSVFSGSAPPVEEMQRAYDTLFREKELWLYGAEYTTNSGFQRSTALADIMGFYSAFGVQPDKDRPDALTMELEFMYYLIFKTQKALKEEDRAASAEHAAVCRDAQKKFFSEYLYPAATQIAQVIIDKAADTFYTEASQELLEFMEQERKYFEGTAQ